jgi:outer membrane cobalamin receptor
VTVISDEALRETASQSVADALAARAPVHVRRYGPSGLATVTVRGAASSQTLVLLDGQRLADPQLGQVDLSLLPAALLGSVEVLSGPASGLYGSDAVGGVVHLRTPTPGSSSFRATTEAGPWGERRASGLVAAETGGVRALVAAEAAGATDDYTFTDETRFGAPRVRRAGWDSRRASAFASVRGEGGEGAAGLSLWLADAERGLGGTDAVGARQWDRLARFAASASRPTAWGGVEAAASVQRASLRYASPFPAPPSRPDAIDDTGRTTTLALDLRARRDALGGAWTAALATGLGRAAHPSLAETAEDRFVGAALAGRQSAGPVTVFPTLRADLYAPAGGDRALALSPHLGLNARLAERLHAKASAGRAFRMPTLNDRFWQPGGNPDLRPERAWSADAGAVWTPRGALLEATAFATQARDQIVWLPTAGGFHAPENLARTRTLGLEGSARASRVLRLGGRPALAEAGALATLLDARDLDARQPLRYVPRWTAKAWGGLGWGVFRLDLGARVVGARFTTASGTQPLPAHLVLDGQLGARARFGSAEVRLAVAAENLTDARYQVVQSYPMPPRHARLRLAVRAL